MYIISNIFLTIKLKYLTIIIRIFWRLDMSLIPWYKKGKHPSLFRNTSDLFDVNKMFENFEENLNALTDYPSGLSISSDDKYIYIEADVPGLTAKEVEVSLDDNNVLWVKGERKEESKGKNIYRRSQHAFTYCIPLGEEVDKSSEPQATCKNGVMKITFTKKKEKQIPAKKIQVKEEE